MTGGGERSKSLVLEYRATTILPAGCTALTAVDPRTTMPGLCNTGSLLCKLVLRKQA
jgi:hypothetical protein